MSAWHQQHKARLEGRQLTSADATLEGVAAVVEHDWWMALELEARRGQTACGLENVWSGIINELAALHRLFLHLEDRGSAEGVTLLYGVASEHLARAKAVKRGDQ